MKKLMIILIFIICLLSGCSNKIENGVVVEKKYTPAYVSTMYVMAGNILVPIENENSEKYEICVYGLNVDTGENEKEWKEVKKEVYDNIIVGEKYYDGEVKESNNDQNYFEDIFPKDLMIFVYIGLFMMIVGMVLRVFTDRGF